MKTINKIRIIIPSILILAILLPFSVANNNQEYYSWHFDALLGIKLNRWLNKHAEFRKKLSRKIRHVVAKLSPSDSLSIGKEGWIYYALGNNLDIPKGTYPLTQENLDFQAMTLSNAQKYYSLMGVDFYYLLYPSKTAIYPEYIHGESLSIGETPVDILAKNLIEHTNINVISPKYQIIADKALGKTYMKMDVHASDLGGYAVYKSICTELAAKSGIDISPISVQFIDGEYPIGANGIAGVPNLFGISEIGPIAQYEAKAHQVTEGDFYEKVAAITTSEANAAGNSAWVIFENPTADFGTLLIYGTSMWLFDNIGEQWQLPRYLAENFRRVVYTGINTHILPELDLLVKPDIVIVECPERYSNICGYRDTKNIAIIN